MAHFGTYFNHVTGNVNLLIKYKVREGDLPYPRSFVSE